MTTLSDDLRMASRIATTMIPDAVSVETVGTSVYVNFGYHVAVVVDTEITTQGKLWHAVATAWDRTGGVMAEDHIYSGDNLVTALWRTKHFIGERLEEERKIEAMLEESFGPGE